MRRLLFLILSILPLSSCGVSLIRSNADFYPGPAHKDGYLEQGIVEEVVQPCSVPGPTQRRMIVYLPPDYYKDTTTRYPVFYLLHGARGYETSWIKKGYVYETTDSLFREGLAVPCIVVMPNVNQYNNDKDYEDGRFKGAFESILEVNGRVEYAFINDVVHLTDSLYRTIPDKQHRAIAGLSIGGYQTIWLSANHPETFDYVGAMSPYLLSLGFPNKEYMKFYTRMPSKLRKQFQDPPRQYYLFAGKWDIMRPVILKYHRFMNRNNYPHIYKKYPGSHDWVNGWIDEYREMLQAAFKD